VSKNMRFNKAATRGVNLSTLEKNRSSVVLCYYVKDNDRKRDCGI